MTDEVLLDVEDGIATITLDRPARLNAFTTTMLAALDRAVDRINADGSLHGAIVTGAGRGFCAGRDLAELDGIREAERARAVPDDGGHESSMLMRIEVPSIAAVNGPAVGGGLGLAVQCDRVIAATPAVFSDGHLAAGMVPSVAGWFLPRALGTWAALEVFVRPGPITADEALAMGMVHEVVPPDELLAIARRRLAPFRSVPGELLRHTKRLCVRAVSASYREQMELVGLLRSIERRADPGHRSDA